MMSSPSQGSLEAPPLLRVDTESLSGHDTRPIEARSLAALIQSPSSTPSPSFHIPLSPGTDRTSPSVPAAKLLPSQNGSRALDELRKLVAHLLDQLQNREKPPSVFDTFNVHIPRPNERGLGQVVGAFREVVKPKGAVRGPQVPVYQLQKEDNEDDYGNENAFSTEATFDLMIQMKDVLQISVAQGWQIFDEGTAGLGIDSSHGSLNIKSSSPFNLRSSMRRASVTSRRSRSPSPASRRRTQGSELLSQCISILSSIVSEDCRYQIASPRPSKPPNALQSVTLDVAQCLIHLHRGEPSVISRLCFAVIPAFGTFPREMQPRLLAFFENVLLRGVCEDLNRVRGQGMVSHSISTASKEENFVIRNTPFVSIQVDEVPDDMHSAGEDNSAWRPWTVLSKFKNPNLRSTNAPLQPLSVYYLSSTPILAAVLENTGVSSLSLTALYSLVRLVTALIELKKDAYLDILEIVAYHTPNTRRTALSLLFTHWTGAIGHPIISKALPVFSYFDRPGAEGTVRRQGQPVENILGHQFVPWKFQRPSRPAALEGATLRNCRSCSTTIDGFGLLCPGCMCAVHFDCYDYPEGNVLSQYAMVSDSNIQKVAVHRFSFVPSPRRDSEAYLVEREHHLFRLVNIFTLPLCFFCRIPIWGCQALHCTSCRCFAHLACVSDAVSPTLSHCHSSSLDSSHITVSLSTVRHSFADYYGDIFLSSDDLGKRTYEEISVSFAILWTQLQIFSNGLAMGSIVIEPETVDGQEKDANGFELQYLVQLYEAYLSSGKLPVSSTMGEYLHENLLHPSTHSIMFDWSTLAYISSVVKSPYEAREPTFSNSSDLLNVASSGTSSQSGGDDACHPFEIVSLSHMRDALGYEFNLFSDPAARYCLSHLHKLGFFRRIDGEPFILQKPDSFDQLCEFPLPLGFDLSADVETLVSAIEACLSDIDLSVNEMGLLLLVRRFWPNGLASEYALRRLSRALLSWIFAEDDNLVTILRDYVSPGRSLPGVRSSSDPLPWPSSRDTRRLPTSSVNNGGDYVASRRSLLSTYVTRWLFALHEQDIEMYARLLHQLVIDIASDQKVSDGGGESDSLAAADRELRLITKLGQASVTFSILDDLFLMWLEHLGSETLSGVSIPSLQRLLNREADVTTRFSTAIDATLPQADSIVSATVDPWRVLKQTAAEIAKFPRTLQWLRLFARSGVDIDVPIFMEYSSLARSRKASLADCLVLVEAALFSVWLRPIGRQELQSMISVLHSHLEPTIIQQLQASSSAQPWVSSFLRKSLSTCLLLYGCERRLIHALELVAEDEVKDLPSRRKFTNRASRAPDPIIVDSVLINILGKYVMTGVDEVVRVVAKFLHSFAIHASLLESYEVDNFVLRNGKVLCSCVWQFYEIQHHDISSIRTSLLLRVLVVDPQPFQSLLDRQLHSNSWESRLAGLTRLFRIVLDVTSPSFHVEGRQWKSSVLDIFYRCFESMWLDEKEEIRSAVDTWSQTLLPAHLEAISACWNEALPTLPVLERVRLISFLIQLHPHNPSWKVISWDTIIETLLEDDYMQNNGANDDGPAAAHLAMYGLTSHDDSDHNADSDPDLSLLRTSIMLLALRMVSSGIEIDLFSFLKLKFHLVKIIGFSDIALVPAHHGRTFHIHFDNLTTIPEQALPCVNELPKVLDAPHPFELPPSAVNGPLADDDRPCSVLVGTLLVDVSLAVFCSIDDPFAFPVLTVKALLESVMAVIYKHDFDTAALKHMDGMLRKALRKTMDFLLLDISYELRQIALTVIQTYIRRWTAISGSLVIESIEKTVMLIVSLKHNTEDSLVSQARAFIETTLITLAPSGIFCSLCKRPLSPEFFTVVKFIGDVNARRVSQPSESLREILLQSILSQPLDADWKVNHTIVNNVHSYIEVVYHEGYSEALMKGVGGWLTIMARRISGLGGSNGFDANTLFHICSILLQHNKMQSRDLLSCTETVLRVSLSRANVKKESLLYLLQATSSRHRNVTVQAAGESSRELEVNEIAQVILEVLEEVLRLKTRISPVTLNAIVETILSTDTDSYSNLNRPYPAVIRSLGSNGLYFLENHIWSTADSDVELPASIAVAQLVLRAADLGSDVLLHLSADNIQRSSRSNTAVRAWNILLLASLADPSRKHATTLFSQFSAFTLPYYRSLGGYVQAGTTPSESAAVDIEHAYIALKLWLILAQLLSSTSVEASVPQENARVDATRRVWNELWPPFETLVDIFRTDGHDEILPLATTIWSSAANLFIFIHQTRSPIALDTMPQITILNRLRSMGRRDSALNKLSRALNGESLPRLPLEVLVAQAMKDVANAEKLRALDRDSQKAVPDRRRDMRVPT
ncbi:hypothetical protein BV22DRAFT_1063234 [Leucogyrophana mollusca]|uniref:Uncharacterized protein n=1 Tax=Leucogyrophana mollusca TaxID=85980 RepID=A0ACB8BL50_9AGAM|nr:hypothetical protein BV22DRAFT_1063234 [Leucogyrophana mollusca]